MFRPGGRWNESPDADPDTLDGMPSRAEAMQVLMDIESEEVGAMKAGLRARNGFGNGNPGRRQR